MMDGRTEKQENDKRKGKINNRHVIIDWPDLYASPSYPPPRQMDVIKDQSWIRFVLYFPLFFLLFSGEIPFISKRTDGKSASRIQKGTGWIFSAFLDVELKSFRKKKKEENVCMYILRDNRFLPREFNLIFEPLAGQPSCVCCTSNVQLFLLIFDVFRQLPDVRRTMNLRRPRGIITFLSFFFDIQRNGE